MSGSVESAVATITKLDPGLGPYAELAADMITAGEEIDVLSQAYLQDTLWWRVPKRLDAEDWDDAVAGTAALLGELGLDRYAQIARSDTTARILDAWREGPTAGSAAAAAAREASGLVAPDTDALAWGSIMGGEEATALDAIERALEERLVRSGVDPEGRSWKRVAHETTEATLDASLEFPPGQSLLTMIVTERVEIWIDGVREPRVVAWRGAVANRLLSPIDPPDGAEAMVAPMAWVLEQAADGLRLTQSHYLPPAVVREGVERFDWWPFDRPPRSEADVPQLLDLREVAADLRLVRRTGRNLKLTRSGVAALADPAMLWRRLVDTIGGSSEFEAIVAELLALSLLHGDAIDDELERELASVLAALGWRRTDGEISPRDVGEALWERLRVWVALNVVDHHWSVWDPATQEELEPSRVALTDAGVTTVMAYLRRRALAPRHDVGHADDFDDLDDLDD